MRNTAASKCEWCNGSENEDPDYDKLCRAHQAEHEGLSVNELERRDSEQFSEWADAHYS